MKSGHVKMTDINIYKKTEVYNHSDTLKINNIFIKLPNILIKYKKLQLND